MTKKQKELLEKIRSAGELRYWLRRADNGKQYFHWAVGVQYFGGEASTATVKSLCRHHLLASPDNYATHKHDDATTYRRYVPTDAA